MATAFANAACWDLELLIRETGFSGYERIFDEGIPYRGHRAQDFVRALALHNIAVISFEPMFDDPDERCPKDTISEAMRRFDGVLVVQHETGAYHAVAWDREIRGFVDNGRTYPKENRPWIAFYAIQNLQKPFSI